MIRDCESCGGRYDDEFSWTLCPHMPLECNSVPYHATTNPRGYCRRCDRIGPHDCLDVEDRRRAQKRANLADVVRAEHAYTRPPGTLGGPCDDCGLSQPEHAERSPTASEAPLPHGFIGAGIVLKEGQRLELLPDGSARIRRSPTDEWEHHEAHTEMARILWACAAPLKPTALGLLPGGQPERSDLVITAIDYVSRTITLERA